MKLVSSSALSLTAVVVTAAFFIVGIISVASANEIQPPPRRSRSIKNNHQHHSINKHSDNYPESHNCIHDSEILPLQELNPIVSLPQNYPRGRPEPPLLLDGANKREARAQAGSGTMAQKIRFKFGTLDLFNESRYCTTVGQSAPTFKPEPAVQTLVCADAEDIFTAQKRDDLINVYLPKAFAKLSEVLSVIPLVEPIVGITQEGVGPLYTKPQSWITTGVPDCDYAFVVAAGITVTNNIAFATTLATVPSDGDARNVGRPLVGALNIGPRYIPANTPDNTHNIEKFHATLLHEMTHALGLSFSSLSSNFGRNVSVLSQSTVTRGGLRVSEMVSPAVRDAVRIYYDCPDLAGMEMEIFGGDGTAGSHWTRRNLYESYMTGVQGDVNRLDNITLAAFYDMGYYFPVWDAAEPMYYGNKSGCSFIREKCNSSSLLPAAKDLFCVHVPYNRAAEPMCSYNLHGIGKCSTATFQTDLEPEFQYYSVPSQGGTTSLMQYCSFVGMFSNQRCWLGNIDSGDGTSKLLGHTFGAGSRCVPAAALISDGFQPPPADQVPVRCVVLKCETQKTPGYLFSGRRWQVFVQVRTASWIACPYDGSAGQINAPSGFSGTITCPKASDVCIPGSRGFGPDITVTELPEITATTITTWYTDLSGSTYTPAPPTAVPTAAPTSAPTAAPPTLGREFTLGTTTTATCQTVVQGSNSTWINRIKASLAKDLDAALGTTGVTIRNLALDGNGCLAVSVDIPPAADAAFQSKVKTSSEVATLLPSTSSVMLENAPSSVTPSALSLSAVANTPTSAPVQAPDNSSTAPAGAPAGEERGPMCFIPGAPCWVSSVVLSIVVAAVVAAVFKVVKSMCCGDGKDKQKEDAVLGSFYEKEMQAKGRSVGQQQQHHHDL